MQAASVALYSELIPYVTNNTRCVRYYSFYPWLARAYARSVGSTDVEQWIRFLRRSEALLALSSVAADPGVRSQGVVGNLWAGRVLRGPSGADVIDFAADAEPGASDGYFKRVGGALAQAYRNTLELLGVLQRTDEHDVPVPGSVVGERLAEAFENAVSSREAERFLGVVRAGAATLSTLKELGGVFGPAAIPMESDERAALEEVLFSPPADVPRLVRQQTESLRLWLHIARQFGRTPTADELRWALYSGYDDKRAPLELPSALSAQFGRWQAYQANEICHVAAEALLLRAVLSMTGGERGVAHEDVVGAVVAAIESDLPTHASTWAELRSSIKPAANAWDVEDVGAEATWWQRIFDEPAYEATAAAAVRLLALLDARWSADDDPVTRTFTHGLMPLAERFPCSVLGVLSFLRARADDPLPSVLAEFVERFVIEQHIRVALHKLHQQGQSTFLFESRDGRLVHRATATPVSTSPRMSTSLTFLRDLALIDETGPTPLAERWL